MSMLFRTMLIATVMATTACGGIRTRQEPGTKPVHEVIDELKVQLGSFGTQTWYTSRPAGTDDTCRSATNLHEVYVRPVSAKVSFKTVLGREQSGSGSFEFPLNILTISPAFSGSYNQVDTNTLDLEFALAGPKDGDTPSDFPDMSGTHSDLYRAIAQAAREITLVNHGRVPCLSPKTMKATITFAVSAKSGGGVDIRVLGIKLGSKVTVTDDQQQTLEVVFSLAGSSEALNLKID